MNSTSLRHKIEFGYLGDENATTYERKWVAVYACMASKYETRASEAIDKGLNFAQDLIFTRFAFRNDRRLSAIKTNMQIRHNGFIYEIKSLPTDADAMGRWKQIEAVKTTRTYK